VASVTPPLWRCSECGREFANRNQSHTCGLHDLEHHFAGKPPAIRALYDRAAAIIQALGPVRVLPEKTRIAFQVRMSFAQLTPRQRWIDGHVVLARRLEHPRFRRVETFSPRHLHAFRLESAADLDTAFKAWVREAYAVGEQRHLESAGRRPPATPPAGPLPDRRAPPAPPAASTRAAPRPSARTRPPRTRRDRPA
jgi:uncharacterized protein DUF5655